MPIRSLSAAFAVVLTAAAFTVVMAAPAGATTVSDEATFRAAWANASETSIVLSADITLTNCGSGAPSRASATPLTLTGNGHTITQTCPGTRVLSGGAVTYDGVTITGGDAADFGGGILASASITLNNSLVTGNHAATSGGSWLTFPMASNSPDVIQYTSAIISAVATPLSAPRFPTDRAKGNARTAITRVMSGKAIFFCKATRRRTTSKPLCCRSRM